MLPYFVNVANFPWNHPTLAFLDCKWHVTKEVSGMAKMKNHRFLSILFNFPQQILYRFDRLSFVIFWPLLSEKFKLHFQNTDVTESEGIPCFSVHTCTTHAKQQLMLRSPFYVRGAALSLPAVCALGLSFYFFHVKHSQFRSWSSPERTYLCYVKKKASFWRQKSGKTYNKCFWLKIHTCLKYSAWICFSFWCCSIEENQCYSLGKNQGKIEWFLNIFLH